MAVFCSFCANLKLSALTVSPTTSVGGTFHKIASILAKKHTCPFCGFLARAFPALSAKSRNPDLYLRCEPDPSGNYHSLDVSYEEETYNFPLIATDPRFIARLISSTADLQYARQMLELCESSHPTCRSFFADSLPPAPNRIFRVVDASSSPPKLVSRLVSETPYVALSYVWGYDLPGKTLRSNLADREKIGLSEPLPKTYRDALEVVRRFGMKWIWIDALCIIQDDGADVMENVSQMHRIYAEARFTIAALVGSNADGGLGLQRTGDTMDAIKLPNGLEIHPPIPSLEAVKQNSTWNTRGWTYQERLLSPRILLFTPHYISMECDVLVHREDALQIPFTYKWEKNLRKREGCPRYDRWPIVVENFTNRCLTFAWDAIPAVTGIMKMVEKRERVKFYHGLCSDNLHIELLWQAVDEPLTRAAVRPGKLELPTWSWARWAGQVGCEGGLYKAVPEANVEILKGDEGRKLRIGSGQELRVVAHREWSFPGSSDRHVTRLFGGSAYTLVDVSRKKGLRVVVIDGKDVGWCAFDDKESNTRCVKVACLALSRMASNNGKSFNVLLVERARNGNWRRLGVGEVLEAAWNAVKASGRAEKVITLE